MIGPRWGGFSDVRWSDDVQENGVIDVGGLATCGTICEPYQLADTTL
jgi:hypothetical protein